MAQASRVELNVHPFGLGGGYILSGSAIAEFTDAFQYFPLQTTTAIITLDYTLLYSGSLSTNGPITVPTTTYTAGIPVNGPITAISQSSGIAILYRGVTTPTGPIRL